MDDKQKTKDQLLSKIKKLEQQINPPNNSISDSEQSNDKIDRFSRIFEDSLNEIFLFDVETYKFDQVNHAAQQNLGYTMEELKELTPLDIKPEHTAESFAALVAPLIKGEKRKIIFETVHQRKDQSLYDAEVHLQILDAGDSREFAAIILDTTERKMTEKKLLESEAKFKALVTQNEEIIYMIDKDGIFQLSEGKGLEKLGLNPGEVVGQSVYDLYKDYPEMLANMKSTFNGESVAVEHKVGDIYYKSWYTPQSNASGEIIGLLGLAIDITERKQMEKSLLVEKQFSESLLSNLPGVFYLISKAGKFLRWNAKFEAVTDRSAEEMAQISPIDLFEGEDKPAIASAIERVFTHGQVQVEGQLVSKAGQSMPYQFSGEKIMVDGAPCLLGIGVDVSKLKQSELKLIESEEKLGLALNGADAGLWSWNVKTGEDVLDERWCGILGYRQAEVTQEISSWENMMHPDDKERIMDVVYKHLEDETNEYNHEYRLKCKNGDWKWVQALGKIVERDINGEPVRMAGIILDIAERKETEAELEQHKQQLEHLVLERTRELEIKNADLDKAMKVFVGREIKIIELEKRIKALQSK